MLSLGACAGLRRAEIAACRGDDLERDLDGWSLRVLGKGGRVRRVPLTDEIAEQIRARGPGAARARLGRDHPDLHGGTRRGETPRRARRRHRRRLAGNHFEARAGGLRRRAIEQ